MGKIGVMARGAKKPKSRLSSVSQLFTYGMFLIQKGSGLGSLQQGEIISSLRELREDIYRTAYGAYIVELVDKLTDEHHPNPFLFEILLQTLQYMNEGIDLDILTFIFEMKMLQVAGIQPKLDGCVNCHQTEGNFAFSIREGGFLCHRCFYKDPHLLKISPKTVKLLRLFYYLDLKRLGKVQVKDETKEEIKFVLRTYFDEYAGLHLKSQRFLDQLKEFNV